MDNVEKKLAKKIWNIPFASLNLHKLTKKELLILIESILLDKCFKTEEWNGLDIKAVLFEQKCYLIECLANKFFESKE